LDKGEYDSYWGVRYPNKVKLNLHFDKDLEYTVQAILISKPSEDFVEKMLKELIDNR